MIYEALSQDEPIRQGDIFRDLPRVDISLQDLTVLTRSPITDDIEHREMSWDDALRDGAASELQHPEGGSAVRVLRAVLPVCPVTAIVITQDCDAAHAEDMSLCEISDLPRVFKNAEKLSSTGRWVKNLTRQGTDTTKWFYLPPDPAFGIVARMAVDFQSVLRLPRPHLEKLKALRVGRLKPVAYEHFREKLAEFFRRYPYDPWYPLNKEEFQEYLEGHDGAKPFEWQK